jgi:hypothetical protein
MGMENEKIQGIDEGGLDSASGLKFTRYRQ